MRHDLGSRDQFAGGSVHHHRHQHESLVAEVFPGSQHGLGAVPIAKLVDQHVAGWHPAPLVRAVLRELDHPTDLRQQHVIALDIVVDTQFAVERHVPVFAVDRHRIGWLEEVDHLLELVAGRVPGDVNATVDGAVDDLGALAEQVVDGLGDGVLVAGDRGGRHQDDVSTAHANFRMLARGDPGQRRRRFALTAGGDDHTLVPGEPHGFIQRYQQAVRRIEVAELQRDASVLLHAATGDRDLATMLFGGVQRHHYPAHVGREGRDDDLPLGMADDVFHRVQHDLFGRGAAFGLDSHRVREQR